MSYTQVFRGPLLLLAALAMAAPTSAPILENEQLHYNINWPSGLSLGEAQLSASSSKSGKIRRRFYISTSVSTRVYQVSR